MTSPDSPQMYYVAVHGGAGRHSKALEGQVKTVMKRACTEALQMVSRSSSTTSALSVVELAISILEDEDCLNAGHGSNLTFEGTVECDAAIMDGRMGDFGSVGAVSGVKNPIKLANAVLMHARVPDRLCRIRPLTLVSSGARAFAETHGIQTVDPTHMIAPRAMQDWQRWMRRYDEVASSPTSADNTSTSSCMLVSEPSPAAATSEGLPHDAEMMQDTVGAVVWDSQGNLAAGVSSGGLLLKYSGRIGEVSRSFASRRDGGNDELVDGLEAAVFGAGCWAEQSRDGRTGMACSISGAGEHIVRAGLARTVADVLRPGSGDEGGSEVDVHELLMGTLSTRFHDPVMARGDTHPHAGVLLMTKEVQKSGNVTPRLWCAFTTESMAVAYASSEKVTPKAKILRRPQTPQPVMVTSPVYITALRLHD